MIAGQLELQLLADVARLKQDMDKALGIVQRGSKAMEDAAAKVRAALGGIGAGLSAAAFGAWIKGAIDLADNLNDLSKSTDIAVGKLAGLKMASRQSGADLEGTAQAINKLSLNMGKNAEKFAAIGITAKQPLEAFKQLSDVFRSIQDPQLRAAVAAEALGKSWAGAAPLLSEGSKKIQEMVDKGELLSGMNQGVADSADEFNDRLVEMQTALGGTAMKIAGGVLPLLTEMTSGFTASAKEAQGADGAFNIVTETLRALIVIGGNVAFVIRGIFHEVGGLAAQAGAMLRGDFAQAVEIGRMMRADAEANRSTFDAWEARMMAAGTAAKVTAGDAAAASTALSKAQQDALKAFSDSEAAKKAAEAVKAAAAEAKKLADAYDALVSRISGKDAGVDADFIKNLKLINEEGRKRGQNDARINELAEAYIAQQPYMKEQVKILEEEAKARSAVWAEALKQAEAYEKTVDGLDGENRKLREEIELIGKTAAQQAVILRARNEVLILTKEQELATLALGSAETGTMTRRQIALEEEIRLLRERGQLMGAKEMAEAHATAATAAGQSWKQVSDSFVDNLMQGGKSVAKYLKDLFRTLVLRPLLQPIGGAMAGMVGALPASANAGGSGLLGMAGNLTGINGSMFGGVGSAFMSGYTGIAGLGAAGAGGAAMMGGTAAMGTMLATDAMGATVLAGAAGATGTGGIMAGVTGALGAIPVAGWIALAGLALYSAFGGKGGGPKSEAGFIPAGLGSTQGSAFGNADTFESSRLQRGDVAGAQQISQGISASYEGIARQLGIVNTKLNVGLFYALDNAEGGDSMTQLQVVTDSYNRSARTGGIENVARGEEALKKEIADETIRVIYSGLLDSELADKFKDYLRQFDISSDASVLQGAITLVSNAKQLFTVFDRLGPAFGTVADMSVDAMGKLIAAGGGMETFSSTLTAYYEAYYSAEEKRRAIVDNIVTTLNRAGIDVTASQVAGASRAQLRALEEWYAQAGDSGKAMALLSVAQAFASITPEVQALSTVLESTRLQLESDVEKAADALTSARRQELTDMESMATRLRAFAADLRKFRDSLLLGDLSPLTPGQKYAEAARQFQATYQAALGGDQNAMGRIQEVSSAFLEASRTYNASSDAYLADFAAVQSALTIGVAKADEAVVWAETQAAILTAQLSAQGETNTKLLSIEQLLANLGQAVVAALTAGLNPGAGSLSALTGGVTGQFVDTVAGQVYASSAGAAATGGRIYTINGGSYSYGEAQGYLTQLYQAGQWKDGYYALKSAGVSMADGNNLMGWPGGTIEQWARDNNLPIFHEGTPFVPQTGFALLERGERVVSRSENSSGNKELVAEVKALRQSNADLMQRLLVISAEVGRRTLEKQDEIVQGVRARPYRERVVIA